MHHKVLVLCLLISQAAGANVTVGELSNLQSQTLLLKAQLAQASLKKQLSDMSQQSDNEPIPVVKSVEGVGSKLTATFLYANGTVVNAKRGDTLPGGYKVERINPEQVTLIFRGKRLITRFSAQIPEPAAPIPVPPAFSVPLRNNHE